MNELSPLESPCAASSGGTALVAMLDNISDAEKSRSIEIFAIQASTHYHVHPEGFVKPPRAAAIPPHTAMSGRPVLLSDHSINPLSMVRYLPSTLPTDAASATTISARGNHAPWHRCMKARAVHALATLGLFLLPCVSLLALVGLQPGSNLSTLSIGLDLDQLIPYTRDLVHPSQPTAHGL